MGEKTEVGSAYSDCVDGKAKGEGKRRVFGPPPACDTRSGNVEASVQKTNHDKLNFKVKGQFTPKLGGMC